MSIHSCRALRYSGEGFPPEKRPFAGRSVLPIAFDEPTILGGSSAEDFSGQAATLRLVTGVDQRVPHRIKVSDPSSGECFGVIPALYATSGGVFEFLLTPEQVAVACRHGLALQLGEEMPAFWAVAPDSSLSPRITPHLYVQDGKSTPEEAFLALFCSEASLQPCDWMEACVLDGLRDLARLGRRDAAEALRLHLGTFFFADGSFIHENLRGVPQDGVAGGAENNGPFAILAMEEPSHPALPLVETDLISRYHEDTGGIYDGPIVAETSYSAAYPLMALALFAGRERFYDMALSHLELNRRYLAGDDDLWLRHDPRDHVKTFQNWSRGVAWYYLGLVRTLALLPSAERPASLCEEVARMAAWVRRHQLANGLWPCFLKENDILPDTSGTAGIAAAVALAVRHEMLDSAFLPIAASAWEGLLAYLTPDGWLKGVAQSNKRETHHMDIQRDEFRVIGPWGMGLMAQLAAALGKV